MLIEFVLGEDAVPVAKVITDDIPRQGDRVRFRVGRVVTVYLVEEAVHTYVKERDDSPHWMEESIVRVFVRLDRRGGA